MFNLQPLRAAIELLYSDKMDITSPVTAVIAGITKTTLPAKPQVTDVPCHIGWPTGTQDATSGTHTMEQNQIIVSCSPSVHVTTGSRITIHRYDYLGNQYAVLDGTIPESSGVSGAASVGASHQELPVSVESVS